MPAARKSKPYVVDFSKDTSEDGRRRFPEGDYKVKVVSHKTGESKEKGTPFVQVNLEITEGKYKGDKVSDRLYMTDGSLWRVRSFLEAMGVSVPRKKMSVVWSKYYGNELGITLSDDEYEGRVRSRISDFIDTDTLAEPDDEDEDELEEEEDEDESDALDDMDRRELKAYIKTQELDIKVKKDMNDEAIRVAIRAAEGDDEEEDLEEFDPDEEL
jgi:hypothetical protein